MKTALLMKRARILAQARDDRLSVAFISLAFIFSASIMRALPHIDAELVHRFLTYLSCVHKARLSK